MYAREGKDGRSMPKGPGVRRTSGRKPARVRLCERVVNGLKRENIKLVALDFDLTLVSIHTQGRWTGSAETLSKYLRPIFIELISQCLRRDIVVAIVTYSQQTELIARTLEHAMDASISPEYGRVLQNNILLRGMDDTWSKPNITCLPSSWAAGCYVGGKMGHILAVVRQLTDHGTHFQRSTFSIRPENVLYFDDDIRNCEAIICNTQMRICTAVVPVCFKGNIDDLIAKDLENRFVQNSKGSTGEFESLSLDFARGQASSAAGIRMHLTSFCSIS